MGSQRVAGKPVQAGTPGRAFSARSGSSIANLVGACIHHATHDGYTDLIYVLLPLWQHQFALGYAGAALLRSAYYGVMALLQLPADRLTVRISPRLSLTFGMLVAAVGFLVMATSSGITGLSVGLMIAGTGSSVQHPRGSAVVTSGFVSTRAPLGLFNFAGDVGKAALPALTAVLLRFWSWHAVLLVMAAIGVGSLCAAFPLLPSVQDDRATPQPAEAGRSGDRGFTALFVLGVLDTATRMGFLLFLPFLLISKGARIETVGAGLTLVFVGGALGKFACGLLAQRFGIARAAVSSELATSFLIIAVVFLPLDLALVALPLLGVVLNGTSSILYGTVPEVARGSISRAFAIFYTGVIGSGAVAPVAYGLLADHVGRQPVMLGIAVTALATLPVILVLSRVLNRKEVTYEIVPPNSALHGAWRWGAVGAGNLDKV